METKQCKRCLVNEVRCLNMIPGSSILNIPPRKFEYRMFPISREGICYRCETEINKINYDKKHGNK